MSKKSLTIFITIFAFVALVMTPLFLTGQGGFANVYATVNTNPAKASLSITAGEAGLSSEKDPLQIAGSIVEFLLGFLGIIFIVLLMYGGFLRMTANGAADKISTSNKIITSAIIGVFIILASWIITAYVFGTIQDKIGEGQTLCAHACVSPSTCEAGHGTNLGQKDNCASGQICCSGLNPQPYPQP
jgi:hypothetical protein